MPYSIRCILFALVLLAAACGGETPATTPAPTSDTSALNTPAPSPEAATLVPPTSAAQQPATQAPPQNNAAAGDTTQIVARVNGTNIARETFERALLRRQQEVQAADASALRQEVLDQLIELAVIEQAAAAQQLTVTDAEVQAELQSYISDVGGESAWQEWLLGNLYTADEFAAALRANLITFRVRDALTADLNGNVRQVHARHILVRTEAEANAALTRLQNGEDFAALARELTRDDTTRETGGDLGWFTVDELLVPQLAQTAFTLQPGQIGGPVGTELGYHVIQTIEFGERTVDPPERRVVIAQTRFENWLRPLLDNATIERFI